MSYFELLMFSMIFFIFAWAISLFFFSRITVRHIENEMAKVGKSPPAWDKGIGVRLSAYSLVILFPNINRNGSLIDVESTLRYRRKRDWYLALFVNAAFYLLFIQILICYFVYVPST
ncbi:MAG: hypothetical protein HRU20_26970 [Pseudomonadales bacterium]|nr:hypothetical protein [Pseudomonadales bacterium]